MCVKLKKCKLSKVLLYQIKINKNGLKILCIRGNTNWLWKNISFDIVGFSIDCKPIEGSEKCRASTICSVSIGSSLKSTPSH